MPVLNESTGIVDFLEPLQKYRFSKIEIILVDGGSDDTTIKLATPLCDIVQTSEPGRANQMNAGAKIATGDILLFLHADTLLPNYFPEIIEESLTCHDKVWGRFDVSMSGDNPSLRMIAFFMNLRSRLTGIATGDQAIFVEKTVFHQLKGFQNIPLMEDVAFSKSAKKMSRPVCLSEKLITSSRRWEKFGIWRTIFLMWQLRLAYFVGVNPCRLAKKYG